MRKLSGYGPSLIVLFTAMVVLFVGPRAVQQLTYEQTKTQIIQARLNLADTDILERINQAYRDIATIVEPSVVHISAQYLERDPLSGLPRPGTSTGSGWIYDEDGHIVTNHHVIQNAVRIDVQLYNGELREAQVLGADPSTDIAVIEIAPGRLHPAQLADPAARVSQGDLVFAFGSPFDFRFSMSSGVVSGKDRSVGVLRDSTGRRLGYENFIQVDAAINPGNSGGPLTDYHGQVIGMNTAIATGRPHANAGGFDEGQFAGIGLAIPLDMIRPVVTQLIKSGFVEKGFLGVNVPFNDDVNVKLLREMGFGGSGVVLTAIQPDEAADRAGVQPRDVVTHIDGRAVGAVGQLRSIISSMLPGQTATLSIWRYDRDHTEGQTLEIAVPLAKLDLAGGGIGGGGSGPFPIQPSRDSLSILGIARMATNTPELAKERGVKYVEGVVILEFTSPSGLAYRLNPGAVLVEVMERPVRSVEGLFRILRDYDLRDGVHARFVQPDGSTESVFLRVEL